MALTDKLSAIGEAIRAKTGKSDKLTLDEMPAQIAGITGGGSSGSGSADGCVTVTFMNGGTVLFSRPVYIGDDCPNPITQGHIAQTPTKESTAQYDYTYSGWCAADGGAADATVLQNITEDKIIYAAYTSAVRSYTITFYDEDGTTVLATQTVKYGSKPSYTPTKSGYILVGWTPEPASVTGDASYVAVWGTVKVILPEQTIAMARNNSNGYGQYEGTIPAAGISFDAAGTYKVLFDGTEYEVTYWNYGQYYAYYKTSSAGSEYKGVYGFGSPFQYKYWWNSSNKLCTLQNVKPTMSTGSSGAIEDNGLPFYICYDKAGTAAGKLYCYTDKSSSHTIYVYQEAA